MKSTSKIGPPPTHSAVSVNIPLFSVLRLPPAPTDTNPSFPVRREPTVHRNDDACTVQTNVTFLLMQNCTKLVSVRFTCTDEEYTPKSVME